MPRPTPPARRSLVAAAAGVTLLAAGALVGGAPPSSAAAPTFELRSTPAQGCLVAPRRSATQAFVVLQLTTCGRASRFVVLRDGKLAFADPQVQDCIVPVRLGPTTWHASRAGCASPISPPFRPVPVPGKPRVYRLEFAPVTVPGVTFAGGCLAVNPAALSTGQVPPGQPALGFVPAPCDRAGVAAEFSI